MEPPCYTTGTPSSTRRMLSVPVGVEVRTSGATDLERMVVLFRCLIPVLYFVGLDWVWFGSGDVLAKSWSGSIFAWLFIGTLWCLRSVFGADHIGCGSLVSAWPLTLTGTCRHASKTRPLSAERSGRRRTIDNRESLLSRSSLHRGLSACSPCPELFLSVVSFFPMP